MRTSFKLCAAFAALVLFTGVLAAQDWTLKSPAHVPAKRMYTSMAQFSNQGQFKGPTNVVMFGGLNLGPDGFFKEFNVLGDTWVWDDNDWRQITLSTAPSPRYGASMAYYPGYPNGTGGYLIPPITVLFGGKDAAGNLLGDTWVFSARTSCFTKINCVQTFAWTQVATTGPPARVGASMAYSTVFYAAIGGTYGDGIILNGGFDGTFEQVDTWRFDAFTLAWSFDTDLQFSPGRDSTAVASCPKDQGAVLFGGSTGSFPLSDTWHHIGADGLLYWEQDKATTHPGGRFGHGMALYPVSNRDILYGGQGLNSFLRTPFMATDTWNFDCETNLGNDTSTWSPAAPAHNPGFKSFQGMSTGPNGLSVVMFGGNGLTFPQFASGPTPNGQDSNQTWTWGRRVACLPASASELEVASQVSCRFDTTEGMTFGGWSTQGFTPWAPNDATALFRTESPGPASITAYWTEDDGPHSQTFTYTIAMPNGK